MVYLYKRRDLAVERNELPIHTRRMSLRDTIDQNKPDPKEYICVILFL